MGLGMGLGQEMGMGEICRSCRTGSFNEWRRERAVCARLQHSHLPYLPPIQVEMKR